MSPFQVLMRKLPAVQDYTLGQLQQNEPLRARQLCKTLSQLGPSFVKIGQALSSRPDLLPQVYLEVRPSLVLPCSLILLQGVVAAKASPCRYWPGAVDLASFVTSSLSETLVSLVHFPHKAQKAYVWAYL